MEGVGGRVVVGRKGGMDRVGLGPPEWDGGGGGGWEEAAHDGDRILWEEGHLSEGTSGRHGKGWLAVPYPAPCISQQRRGSTWVPGLLLSRS